MNMSNSAVSKMSEMLLAQHIVICNCLKTYHFMHCHTQKSSSFTKCPKYWCLHHFGCFNCSFSLYL